MDALELDALKADRGRLVDVLTQAGAEFVCDKVKCPFHDDAHPSAGIYSDSSGSWRFRCFACNITEDVIGVVQRVEGCDFATACDKLQSASSGHIRRTSQSDSKPPKSSPVCDHTKDFARDAHARLLRDPEALEKLWTTRSVDVATATRFGIGITDAPVGDRYWVFPIRDADGSVTKCKLHTADSSAVKCKWMPRGATACNLFPKYLAPDGPVWLCPGELKALAVTAVGRAAVGITSGEGQKLPLEAFDLLLGREVAIVPDDDAMGAKWGPQVLGELHDAEIKARIVDLGLDRSAGIKDIGDWIRKRAIEDEKEPSDIAATLDEHWQRSDPWFGVGVGEIWRNPSIWSPVTHVATSLAGLDAALGGGFRTKGVHLLGGKTGHAKTQLAATIAINAAKSGTPSAILSLEMSADELGQLAAAQLGDISRIALATGSLDRDQSAALDAVKSEYADLPLSVLDDQLWPSGLTRERLTTLVAEGVKRFGWKMVILDYLSLLAASTADRDQYDSDLRNSTTLRSLARKYDIALLVVVALRKGARLSKPENISLDDFLGAGRLVYDAQTVFSVWCEIGDVDTGLVYARPLKVRFAPCDEEHPVQLRWHPRTGRIEDLE